MPLIRHLFLHFRCRLGRQINIAAGAGAFRVMFAEMLSAMMP